MKRKSNGRHGVADAVAAGLAAGVALTAAPAQAAPIFFDPADITISPLTRLNEIPLAVSGLVNARLAGIADFSLVFTNPPNDAPSSFVFRSLNSGTRAMGLGAPLGFDQVVGPGGSFLTDFTLAFTDPPSDRPTESGPFVGAGLSFLGFVVDVPGLSPHFGWLQLRLDSSANLTVYSYAIESAANTPIMTPIPEPSSLALLAAGLAGLALWRRRRAGAAA